MNIVITMAGHSRRFAEKGYTKPKYLIDLGGRAMLNWVCNMFDPENDQYHFVVNSAHLKAFPEIPDVVGKAVKKHNIVPVDAHEKGPVWTALQASGIANDAQVIVCYCDFFVDWDYEAFKKLVASERVDGAIPSFTGFQPASFGETYYAYTRQDETNTLIELREKRPFTEKRHEEKANAGIYYFRTWALFRQYATELEERGYDTYKEGYVSLLANPMVKDGLKIKTTDVSKFICFGTPEDVEQFLAWYKVFQENGVARYSCTGQEEQEMSYWRSFFAKHYSK